MENLIFYPVAENEECPTERYMKQAVKMTCWNELRRKQ